ncbi:hypothetical protein GSUET_19220 [Geobacter sulfurreducens subsp. ethanolicus]|uniref:hypothetical protein n=1 Tax=Geobacter sulfurreducens TaxID=35554 RepID=UPI00257361FB|nr:hypothetical protein [Geobacter sulfurreducens]BEH10310.1 hypothetical protein GSUET_19220 [Geobacter sulfurreducens subsp. ethanolicus]
MSEQEWLNTLEMDDPSESDILELLKEIFGEDTHIDNLKDKTKILKKETETQIENLRDENLNYHNMIQMIMIRYMLSLPYWDDSMYFLKNWSRGKSVYIPYIYLFLKNLNAIIKLNNITILTVNKITKHDQIDLNSQRTIYLAIDLEMPMEYILDNVEKVISRSKKQMQKCYYWDRFASELKKQSLDITADKLKKIGKPQQEWISYIKAYDLRKLGLTYREIAEKVIPYKVTEVESDRIRKQVNTAEKLMDAWFGELFFNNFVAKQLRVYRICKNNHAVKEKFISSVVDGLEQIIKSEKFDKDLVAQEIAKHYSL